MFSKVLYVGDIKSSEATSQSLQEKLRFSTDYQKISSNMCSCVTVALLTNVSKVNIEDKLLLIHSLDLKFTYIPVASRMLGMHLGHSLVVRVRRTTNA